MAIRILYYAFWILAPIVQVVLAVYMVRRNLRREFPVFFSYTVFQFASFCFQFTLYHLAYLIHGSYEIYFYGYWTSSAVGMMLGLGVIYEIFKHIFRPYDSLRHLGTLLFRWSAFVLVMVALVTAALGSHGQASRIMATIMILDRSIRIMQCGLVFFLFLFSNYLGITSRHHLFGIALGFGLFAAVDLILVTLQAAFGPFAPDAFSLLKSGTYNVAVGIWIYTLLSPEPARRTVPNAAETARWNYALSGVMHASGNNSFLPMIEDTVNRILSHNKVN